MDPIIILILSIMLLVFFIASGAPFFVAFVLCSIPFLLLYAHVPGHALGEMAVESVNSFTLVAVPLFIFLGNIMARIGATTDLFNFARSLVGHFRGGLGITAILASALFGAMCGSGLATALAIGATAVPEMTKSGYKRSTIAAICGASGGIGLLIPPSITFIVLGEVLGISVGKLFIAGIVPGLMVTLVFSIVCYFTCKNKKEILIEPRKSLRDKGAAFMKALPSFLVPVVVIFTIYFGIATPTESAAVACVVALGLGYFYYHNLNLKLLRNILDDTGRSTSAIWLIIMGAMLFGRVLSFENIPQAGAQLLSVMGLSYIGFILGLFVLYFILGLFFDAFILMMATLPPLIGALTLYNVDLYWFGVIFTILVITGQITPPVGITLYAASASTNARTADTIKQVIPYLIALIGVLLFLTAFPQFVIH